ncbi:ccm domain-containing protein, partial [Klebsiella pneumoniae]
LMMSLWDALRMNMMISYQELVRTFLSLPGSELAQERP